MSFLFSQPAPGIVPIDSISFAELAKVDASSVLGNPSGSLADASSITFTNLTSLLDPFAGTLQGLVPASSNTGTLFLRDDGTWVAAGGVTNVTATAPLASSGGLTPDISISQADSTTDGYLSSVDWNTFDSKQPAGDYITDLTGEVTASGPGSVSATIAGQSGNGTKILATNGTTVSWQYAGLGDGSFGANNVILGSGLGSLQNTRTNVIVSSTTNPYTTANNNVCIGSVPGPVNREYSTLVGINVQTYTGLAHTAFGYNAKCGEYGTSIGYGADAGGLFWSGCTAIGFGATCNSGNDAVAVGFQARATRDNTVAVGRNAKTDGANSTVVGAGSGNNATGANNTILGQGSATALTTGSGNTVVGQGNLLLGSTSGLNVIVGTDCASLQNLGLWNVILGYQAGKNFAGNVAVMIGNKAGYNTQEGGGVFIGEEAGYSNGSAVAAIAIGYNAARNTTANYDHSVSIGRAAGYATGTETVAIGYNAGNSGNSTNSVYLGAYAGQFGQNSSFFIDNQARGSLANQKTNSLMYGQFNATPSSQTLTINAEVTATYGVAISTEGKGLAIKTGANAKIGKETFPSPTVGTLTVNTEAVTANSLIFLTGQTGFDAFSVDNIVPSTGPGTGSFDIVHSTGNVPAGEVVAWMIVEATP